MSELIAGGCSALVVLLCAPGGRPVAAARLRALARRPQGSSGGSTKGRRGGAAAAAGAVLAAAGVPPVITLGAGAAVALAALAVRHRSVRTSAAARTAAAVEVVYALAAELRAGRPPVAALTSVAAAAGPLAGPVGEVAAAVRSGAPAPAELARLARLSGCGSLRPVAAIWQVTEQTGGAVAEVLERLGDTLDADERHRQAMAAALAGPRATMALLAVLPAFGLLLGQAMGADPGRLLLHTHVGWALTVTAGLLDALGVVWVNRLTRNAS